MMLGMASHEDLLTSSPEDFGRFYTRNEAAVLSFFRSRVSSPDVAADLTAECFAQALQGRRRYKAEVAPARAWLFGIAGHVLSHAWRRGAVEDRGRRRLGMEALVFDDAALARVDELDGEDTVTLALDGLPDAQREAVRARVLQELSYAEMAERFSVPRRSLVSASVAASLNFVPEWRNRRDSPA